MKRLYVWCLVLLLPILAAASTIEVWWIASNEEIKVAEELIENDFTAKTGIKVNIKIAAWADHFEKALLAVAAGDPPDVLMTGAEQLFDFAIRGAIVTDLNKRFGKEFEDLEKELFPAVTEPLHWLGTRFGIPQNISLMNAAYRTDIFKDMGMEIPNLWSDVYKMMPKLKAKNIEMGFHYGSVNYDALWGAYSLITQHGGNFFKDDGFSSAMDTPEAIRGFKEYIELYTKHKMPTASPGITALRNGEWAMMIDGYWMYTNIINSAPELKGKWEPGLIPGITRPNGVTNHGTFSGATTFGIPKSAKHPKEAWAFLKWFCSTPVQKKFVDEIIVKLPGSLMVPTSRDALYNLSGMPQNVVRTIHAQLDESVAVPYAPTAGVLYRFVDFAVQACVQNGKDPEAEAKKAAAEMNKEMNQRKVEYKRFLDKLQKSKK